VEKSCSVELINGTKDYIVTIAIGDKYLTDWEKFALPFWTSYCKKYGLGLIVICEDLIELGSVPWKKATWQKFLIGDYAKKHFPHIERICYLDTDILISPLAPNVFDFHQDGSMSLVSLFHGLPYNRTATIEKLTWFRNQSSAGSYPLDSAIYMGITDLFNYHGLAPQDDYACAGMFIMDTSIHSRAMQHFFFTIDSNVHTITNGGDQTHFNYLTQSNFLINWISYKFQSIWSYEAANYYPSVFFDRDSDHTYLSIQNALVNNYFLHFAGGWSECQQWKDPRIFQENVILGNISNLVEYQSKAIKSGEPVGHIKFLNGNGKE
jgi:hypothetical protein